MSYSPSPYIRLEIELETARETGPHPDPSSLGPRLRGSLGKALVDSFCAFGEPRCDPKGKGSQPSPPSPEELCRLATACPYGVLYAASLSRRPPFALYVSQGHDAETRLNLEITLYGPGWRHYAWVLASLARAAQHLGSRDLPGLKIAALRRIHPDRSATSHWGTDLSALPADLTPDLLGLAPEPFVAPRPVAIDLLSPTHLLSHGRPLPREEPVPFGILIKSTLDRFAGLYGSSASPVLAQEIRATVEAAAAEVPLLEQDLRAAEASHYSRRSRAQLDLGGVVGRLVYGPQAAAFIHILRAAEILHLGKNPTFGCGRLRVDLLS
jgi:hypothetical protein